MKKQPFLILLLLLILVCMLFHAPVVIDGAHIGLELWYQSVLPSILPFMIITSLLIQTVPGNFICFLGLFCGLPVGANLVNQQFVAGHLSLTSANHLLCICNITSPMFIIGYILHQTLQNQTAPLPFFLSIYIPIILYGILSLLYRNILALRRNHAPAAGVPTSAFSLPGSPTSFHNTTISSNSARSFEDITRHALQVILSVGLYIMLFCILIRFLLCLWTAPPGWITLLASSLEITNGIHLLNKTELPAIQKTALMAGLTSFGGVCSILQTKSVLTDHRLSIFHYLLVKLLMGLTSYLLALWLC